MKVLDLLEARRANWHELECSCARLESVGGTVRRGAAFLGRFASLYRAACADLALSDAYQLPPNTIAYLHQLVGRAHNQLYRGEGFRFSGWAHEMLVAVPSRLVRDRCLWLAMAVFWGIFLISLVGAWLSTNFAERLLSKEHIAAMEEMYATPVFGREADENAGMAGFYIFHNGGITLQCFAAGMLGGVIGLPVLVSNAAILGGTFGHMIDSPGRDTFFEFVTAHGPFELTAIVMGSAAGMRLGFSLIKTGGLTRGESLRLAGEQAVPNIVAAVLLIIMAAFIEGFVSPSALPYSAKAGVALASASLLLFYLLGLGLRAGPARLREEPHATR